MFNQCFSDTVDKISIATEHSLQTGLLRQLLGTGDKICNNLGNNYEGNLGKILRNNYYGNLGKNLGKNYYGNLGKI